MDKRLKLLSYSSLLTLHQCPRKFQLYRLNSEGTEVDGESKITFTFGSVVGEGIQAVFQGHSEDRIIFDMFVSWNVDLESRDDKRAKNFYLAVIAVQKFIALRTAGLLEDYELMYYEGKPAVELGFRITFPDGFKLRGYVDAVLKSTLTGEIVVIEAKTASAKNILPATYKNSAQAIGYSIVLDVIAPELSSYKVIYLVYKTTDMNWEKLEFTKSYHQRALWIQELLLDIETIKLYENAQVYPMRGESCVSFYKECQYMQTCTLSTKALTKPLAEEDAEKLANEKFDVELTLADIVNAQLNKVS